MTFDFNNFDADQVPNADSFDPIPAGHYTMVADKAERKTSANTGNEYLNVEFQVIDEGEYQGKRVWSIFNLWNNSPAAAEIARKQFAELCRAVGVPRPSDFGDILDVPFIGEVKVAVRSDTGEKKNEMKSYSPAGQRSPASQRPAPAASATAAGGSKPWQAKR